MCQEHASYHNEITDACPEYLNSRLQNKKKLLNYIWVLWCTMLLESWNQRLTIKVKGFFVCIRCKACLASEKSVVSL